MIIRVQLHRRQQRVELRQAAVDIANREYSGACRIHCFLISDFRPWMNAATPNTHNTAGQTSPQGSLGAELLVLRILSLSKTAMQASPNIPVINTPMIMKTIAAHTGVGGE